MRLYYYKQAKRWARLRSHTPLHSIQPQSCGVKGGNEGSMNLCLLSHRKPMYIQVSGFENKNIDSSTLDNILPGRINSKSCGLIASLHVSAKSIRGICRSPTRTAMSGSTLYTPWPFSLPQSTNRLTQQMFVPVCSVACQVGPRQDAKAAFLEADPATWNSELAIAGWLKAN